jgi:hypothetical protein
MNWNAVIKQWHRAKASLKSRWDALPGALAPGWLTQLKLKDHYADRRTS